MIEEIDSGKSSNGTANEDPVKLWKPSDRDGAVVHVGHCINPSASPPRTTTNTNSKDQLTVSVHTAHAVHVVSA